MMTLRSICSALVAGAFLIVSACQAGTAIQRSIGLDWGGVDVLRDRSSGRIYIVDANKTDMGPPVALKLGAKLRATRRMAQAFAVAFASKKR